MLKRILYIEDDPVTAMLFKMIIRKNEFSETIDVCEDGMKALDYFENLKISKEEAPQVLFLDLNMPVLTGWEFLDIFKTRFSNDFPNLKILVVSSSVDPTDLQLANNNPMVMSFLSKPIDKIKLNSLKLSAEFKEFFEPERA
jgi:CheY-like chemotaxis protein